MRSGMRNALRNAVRAGMRYAPSRFAHARPCAGAPTRGRARVGLGGARIGMRYAVRAGMRLRMQKQEKQEKHAFADANARSNYLAQILLDDDDGRNARERSIWDGVRG